MIICEIGLCHIEETMDEYQIFPWVHGNLWGYNDRSFKQYMS
jgi:hypothetical protein